MCPDSPCFGGYRVPSESMGLILPEDKHVLGPAWMNRRSHQVLYWWALEFLCRGKAQHSSGARDVPGSCTAPTHSWRFHCGCVVTVITQDFCLAGWSAGATGTAGCTNIYPDGVSKWKVMMWPGNSVIRVSDVGKTYEHGGRGTDHRNPAILDHRSWASQWWISETGSREFHPSFLDEFFTTP